MKRAIALLIIILMAAGLEWGYALSPGTGAGQSVPSSSDTLFRTGITTLDYQGQKVQNRAQTVMFSRADRQKSSAEATYTVSGDAGIRVGKDGQPGYYQSPPVRLKRNLSTDLLSNGQQSRFLDHWVGIINRTLTGLTHKHMTSGEWEEVVNLELGAGFPETVPARFWAAPLPEPENRWVLITVETGLLSFVPLDRRYEEAVVYGRYRGVLAYSPADDAFRQSGAVFDLYRGEDRCRIECQQFAADAEGTRLYPALDVREYLGLTGEPLPIAAQGAFPSWCSQSSLVFDILNAAMMTAAEGATNWPGVADIEQSLTNLLNFVNNKIGGYRDIVKILGQAAADELVGKWMMAIRLWSNAEAYGAKTALRGLILEVGEDLALIALAASGYGTPVVIYKLAKLELEFGKALIQEMARVVAAEKALRYRPTPRLRPRGQPTPQYPPVQLPGKEKPAPEVKKPGSGLKIVGTILGLAAGVVGGLYLAKLLKGTTTEGAGGGSEIWSGTFTDVNNTTTYGEADCRYTTTGSITFNLNRSGSSVTGTNTISNLKDSIVELDPYVFCPPLPHSPSPTGSVKATVNSQGNYVFSSFYLDASGPYPQFTATVSGNPPKMKGSVVYVVPGMIGPSGFTHTLTFEVDKK
jgi:hypothetical protein